MSFTLVDGNSTAEIDTGSQMGMHNWIVDGSDHLVKQWFWYRVGNTPERSIDTLFVDLEGTTDTNFDDADDTLFVRYDDTPDRSTPTFKIELMFGLDGGVLGSHQSDISEQITITNTSDSALDFHFFQYSDFMLDGTVGDDTVELVYDHTVKETNLNGSSIEEVVTPTPDHWEIAEWPVTINKLNDGVATTLSDTQSPLSGDITWALQWDFILGAGDSFQIGKDKRIAAVAAAAVPEPATMLLLGISLAGIAGIGLRRKKKKKK